MKKIRFSNITLIAALILALSCLMTSGVYADEYSDDSYEPIEWEALDENTIVDSAGNEYVYYELPLGAFKYYDTMFYYYNTVDMEGYYSTSVYSTSLGCGIITLSHHDLYATEEERQKLDAFFEGDINTYLMFDGKSAPGTYSEVADVDGALVKELEREYGEAYESDRVMTEVTELADKNVYTVFGRDDTLTVGYNVGAIFELDDGYYYVDYAYLENKHFDSSGYLSFRSGSLPLCKLSQESAAAIDTLKGELAERPYVTEEEYDPSDSFSFVIASFALILLAILVNGILLPIPLAVFGIIMANRKPRGTMRYWYMVSVIAAAWMLIAILLAAVITLVMFI